MGETKVQGCEEKEKVLLLWERALTLFYENDTELFVTGAQERTIAGKIAMHMDKIYREICCEMNKASKPGQGDARKVKRLVRHINYHFGIDLYKINRTEARFTLYYLRTGYKQCQKEEYFFNRKTNQIEPLKV